MVTPGDGPPTLPRPGRTLPLRLHRHRTLVLPLPDRLHLVLPLPRGQPRAEGEGRAQAAAELRLHRGGCGQRRGRDRQPPLREPRLEDPAARGGRRRDRDLGRARPGRLPAARPHGLEVQGKMSLVFTF